MKYVLNEYRGLSFSFASRPLVLVVVTFVQLHVLPGGAVDLSNCRKSLGMQSGTIPDNTITASSSYDGASVGPSNARIRTERNGGAWCPKQQISKNVYEWIEVDLQELKVITQIETQGRFGNGQGQEYAESYKVEYQRNRDWIKFRDRKSNEIFTGNSNTYIAELREIKPPIIARKIRIVPYSAHPRTVCMRIELYGCTWRDGVLSYSMPQGEKRGTDVELFDFTYDGQSQDDYLKGGLGQLTDGAEGHYIFRLDPDDTGRKGYDWVGWKNETVDRPPIEIIFEFDKVRNFSAVRFHCNNMFSKEVRAFRKVLLFFSTNDATYQPQPVIYEYMRDTLIEFARNVIVPIPGRVGRFVKVILYFDSKWMMISEVRFESDIAIGNYTEEHPSTTIPTPLPHLLPPQDSNRNKSENISNTTIDDVDDDDWNRISSSPVDDQLVGIIVGILGAIIMLLIAVIIFCVVYRGYVFCMFCRWCNTRYKSSGTKIGSGSQQVKLNFRSSSSVISRDCGGGGVPSRKVSNGNTYSNIVTCDTDATPHNTLGTKTLSLVNGDAYRQPHDVIQTRQLPDVPGIPVDSADYLSDTNTSTYAVPDINYISTIMGGVGGHAFAVPKSQSPFFATNISKQDPSSSTLPHTFSTKGLDATGLFSKSGQHVEQSLQPDPLPIVEFPRGSLKFIEKLGEGLFGEVHLCEAVHVDQMIGDDFLLNRMNGGQTLLVAVKILGKHASAKAREDFYKKVKMMSRLNDPNIVSLLGVCTREEPLCVIVEYMKYGDLNQFLLNHDSVEFPFSTDPDVKTLSYGCLIYMATQIASGMKFLEMYNIVHRDLATRNCLVGHLYTIKISDFGMSRSLYATDYYHIEGKAVLPIRWMAWESVLLGKFSTRSEIWSFGVTLWEILTYARIQPYEDLTDEQVIENCGHYFHSSGQEICLPQPGNCPKETYDLMVECWNREQTQRPTFHEIHMFLQRKNMGYNPHDEQLGQLQTLPRRNLHFISPLSV